MLVMYL